MGLLKEAYVPPSSLGSNWCLAEAEFQNLRWYVLFDSSGLREIWEKKVKREKRWIKKHGSLEAALDAEALEWKLSPSDFTGVVSRHIGRVGGAVCKVSDFESNKGFWEVKEMAAYDDYGPTMYDLIAMASPKGILSDRTGHTSSFAENVYTKYNEIRKDVDIQPLPYNLQKKKYSEDEYFNKAYKIHDNIEFKRLLNNYQNFEKKIQSIYPEAWKDFWKRDLEAYWPDVVKDIFTNLYREEVLGSQEDRAPW